jgi:hypothetical protein
MPADASLTGGVVPEGDGRRGSCTFKQHMHEVVTRVICTHPTNATPSGDVISLTGAWIQE